MRGFHLRTLTATAVAVAALSSCVPDAGRGTRLTAAYLQLVAAEDARPTSGRQLDVLLQGLAADAVLLRQTSVRALGRLEDPELVGEIAPLLSDPTASIRSTAADALAQTVHGSEGDDVLELLIARATIEEDPEVMGTLAHSIGRLSMSPANRRRSADALVELSKSAEGDAPPATLTGVALGLEALVRNSGGEGLSLGVARRLEELTRYSTPQDPVDIESGRIRALALSTMAQGRRMNALLAAAGLSDPVEGVRVVAARSLESVAPSSRVELIRRAISDRSRQTPLAGLRVIAGAPRNELFCSYQLAGTAANLPAAIRVLAIDALGRPCPSASEQRATLVQIATSIRTAPPSQWHAPAHALISLALTSPDAATELLPDFVAHANPFVRTYGARAARLLRDSRSLATLTRDASPNVRTAAVQGLFALEGHAVDDVLLGQLGDDDPQLLLTVAGLLEASPLGLQAAVAALDAFERISEARRETWRDPRRALVERIAELGGESLSGRLTPFLRDYDAVVADDVAGVLGAWTGRVHEARPEPLPLAPIPTPAEFEELVGASVILHMEGGGTIVIELHPYEATTNVFRFVRLVRERYFDGLTFHRWAPVFVLQGGSPGANEYQGDGPYSRDEVGLHSHWRGTVGISTRGRDTGDGQIFVNLVDNVRLNHDYTIVGTVVEGMDVVDAALEGAVIERAELRLGE